MNQTIKIILIALFACLALASANSTHAAKIGAQPNYLSLNSGLVGYWTFDGKDMVNNVADKSGQGNNGALKFGTSGNTSTSSMQVAGKLGQGLKFDGVDDYVTTSNTLSVTNSTMAGWVIVTGKTAEGHFFEYNPLQTWIINGTITFSNKVNGVYTQATISRNVWTHLAFVCNSVGHFIYVNGVLASSASDTNVCDPSAGPLKMGTFYAGGGYNLSGSLDDVRIYSRALSAGEIAQLYQTGVAKVGKSPDYGPAAATNVKPNLTSGLVGYWTFDGKDTPWTTATAATTLDKSGNYATGTLTNMNRTTATAAGKIGQGLKFDGVDDYVDAGAGTSLNLTSNFTVSLWVKPTMAATNFYLIAKRLDIGHGYSIFISPPALSVVDGNGVIVGSGLVVDNNKWQHIVLVVGSDSTKFTMYKNGIAGSLTTMTVPFANAPTQHLFLGARDGGTYPMKGILDDIRIYNRALSAAEIAQLYQLGAIKIGKSTATNNLASGLVGYWTFDGKDMYQNVADKSGLGNNGALKFGTSGNTSTSSMQVAGKMGQGLKFDGVDDYVDTNMTTLNGASVLTVEFWVKPKAFTGLSFASAGISNNRLTSFGIQGPSYNGYSETFMATIQDGDGHNCVATVKQSNFATDVWYHYVAVFDGTQAGNANRLKVYINGIIQSLAFDGSIPSTTYNAGSGYKVNLGRTYDAGNFFPGSLDDVRIYNRALSASEVTQLYNLGR